MMLHCVRHIWAKNMNLASKFDILTKIEDKIDLPQIEQNNTYLQGVCSNVSLSVDF